MAFITTPARTEPPSGSDSYMRTWGPAEAHAHTIIPLRTRLNRYAVLQGYHDGTAYKGLEVWANYLGTWQLPPRIRLLRSHVKRGIDFYAHYLYPGELSSDGKNLPSGVENAVPLADDTPADLALAIATFWQWTNWAIQKNILTRRTPTLGEFLVELVDKVASGKVVAELVWPGHIDDLQLDLSGNVVGYTKQYQALDDEGVPYQYKRRITKERIIIWHDADEVYNQPNPYGFVPACWYKHEDTGGIHGEPFVSGTQAPLDELNGLLSTANDKLRLMADSPIFVSGKLQQGSISRALSKLEDQEYPGIPEDARPLRERLRMVQMNADFKLDTIRVDMTQIMVAVQAVLDGIHDQCPEVRFEEELREMSQLTGPGAERALGGILKRLRTVASGYDLNSKKLFQMAVAIGGMRANDGSWADANDKAGRGRQLTAAQQAFQPFGLESYAAGRLNFEIMPRTIVSQTEEERINIGIMKDTLAVPKQVIWRDDLGYTTADIQAWAQFGWVDQAAVDDALRLDQLLAGTPATPTPGTPDESVIPAEPTTATA